MFQTSILDELCIRQKNLIHDNCKLSAINECLNFSQADKLHELSQQNTRLVSRASWATAKLHELKQENMELMREPESLALHLKMALSSNDALRSRLVGI